MKKTYSISLEEDLMDKFTKLSRKLWTNKTNFLSMIITDIVKSEQITFYWYNKKQDFEIEQEDFNKDELNSLINSSESKKMEKLLSNIL